MHKKIFYSWQSDLPNNLNRGFIEDCTKLAIKDILSTELNLEIVIDRDTKNISGTPDIANTIFSKIDETSIFIADISIINSDYQGKKTPNPNVLIELGYAAKTIGWNKIICIFNEEYGKVEELPFDLRFRRPIVYKIKNPNNKTKDRKELSSILKIAIETILDKESEKDEINNYIKQQIDKELLTICNHLFKIFYGYDKRYTLEDVWKMISYDKNDVDRELFERKFLGFTVLKDWSIYKEKIESIMNQPFFIQNAQTFHINCLLKLIRNLEFIIHVYAQPNLFENIGEKVTEYNAVSGTQMNFDNLKDSYILLKSINGDLNRQGIVIDFGNIKKYNFEKTLYYQIIRNDKFNSWSYAITELLNSIENWVSKTGNNFIIDPLTFRM